MTSKNRISKKALTCFRILFTTFLFGTIVFIFLNSADIGAVSSGKSQIVMEYINKALAKMGFHTQLSEHIVRKLAHFAEYALLGFWLMLTLRVYTVRIISFISWPLFLGILTAVCDEFFQMFVPGRGSSVKDVVIDFGGVITGLFAGLFALLLAAAIWDAFHKKR